jgi:hypothetical protein
MLDVGVMNSCCRERAPTAGPASLPNRPELEAIGQFGKDAGVFLSVGEG